MKVAVLGAGAFGTALGGVLLERGQDVAYYDPKINSAALSETLDGAKYMLLCVPSVAAPELVVSLPKNIPLIVATKGFLTEQLFLDFEDWMVMSGPGFAKNIQAKQDTFLTATDKRIQEIFETDYLKFDLTRDRRGVLMCGALKNVYAIFAGMKELKSHTEEMEKFIEDAVSEMGQILVANGADSTTIHHACGVGDLVLTCSPDSRNYRFGYSLAKHNTAGFDELAEGVEALKRIEKGDIEVPESAEILNAILNKKDGVLSLISEVE